MSAVELRAGAVANEIRQRRLVVVLRRVEPVQRLVGLVEQLAAAGARVFEITFDAPSAGGDVRAVRSRLRQLGHDSALVGAGTLLTEQQLKLARASGADFGVSPVLDPLLVRMAIADGFPFIPGAFTPSEISAAWAAGATFVKLFPASAAGPQLIRELRGPLPEIELVPTGGVDASNAQSFLDAGAAALGIGSAIVRSTGAEREALVRSIGR